MPSFLVPVNLTQNELRNATIQNLASAPASPKVGQFYYDTTLGQVGVCTNATGPVWAYMATGGVSFGTPAVVLGTAAAAGAATTAMRTDSTIVAFDATAPTTETFGQAAAAGTAAVAARRDHAHGREAMPTLSQVGAPTADVPWSSHKITGLTNGSSAQDAAAFGQIPTALPPNGAAGGDLTGSYPNPTIAAATANFKTQVQTVRLDQMAAPTAPVGMNSQKLTSVLDPTSAQDAATKNYVDATSQGLSVKPSVKAAATAVLTAVPATGGLQIVDGYQTVAGDRVLATAQATASQNGIWVAASGAWTRPTDFATGANEAGTFVFVEGGTANAASGWTLASTGTVTVDTTAQTWTQFSGAGEITAGTGITKTGNSLAVASSYAGGASIATVGTVTTGVWNGTAVPVANGGTGSTTAAAARTALGTPGKYAASFGDGSSTSFTLTHGLGTADIVVFVYTVATGVEVLADITVTSTTVVISTGATVPTTNQYRAVCVG